jgi:hypothetical protein
MFAVGLFKDMPEWHEILSWLGTPHGFVCLKRME